MKQIKGKEWRKILIAVPILMAAGFLISCLMAALIEREVVPEQMGGTVTLILSELAALLVCISVVRKLPQRRLPAALVLMGAYLLLRLLVLTVAYPNADIQWGRAVPTLISAVAAGMVGSMKKQRRR